MHIFFQASGIVCVSYLEIYATNSLTAGRQVLNKLPVKEMYTGPPGWGSEWGGGWTPHPHKKMQLSNPQTVSWKDSVQVDKAWLRKQYEKKSYLRSVDLHSLI